MPSNAIVDRSSGPSNFTLQSVNAANARRWTILVYNGSGVNGTLTLGWYMTPTLTTTWLTFPVNAGTAVEVAIGEGTIHALPTAFTWSLSNTGLSLWQWEAQQIG